jgi:hypothetical protein
MTPEAGQSPGGAAVSEAEIRRHLAGLRRTDITVAGGQQGQRSKQKQNEKSRHPHILIIRAEGHFALVTQITRVVSSPGKLKKNQAEKARREE